MSCSSEAYKINPLFHDVVYVVEADDFARLMLWKENNDRKFINWQELWPGSWFLVGSMRNDESMPVCLSCMFVKLNGRVVCFYECTSRYVDWDIVNKWFDDNLPNAKRTNAMNFHSCINYIKGLK